MGFSLRHQIELQEKINPLVLAKLFDLLAEGLIKRGSLQKMSYRQNMDVVTTFDQCERDRENLEGILERMLDRWYEDRVCNLSPAEAAEDLLRILEATCPSRVSVTVQEILEGKEPQENSGEVHIGERYSEHSTVQYSTVQ